MIAGGEAVGCERMADWASLGQPCGKFVMLRQAGARRTSQMGAGRGQGGDGASCAGDGGGHACLRRVQRRGGILRTARGALRAGPRGVRPRYGSPVRVTRAGPHGAAAPAGKVADAKVVCVLNLREGGRSTAERCRRRRRDARCGDSAGVAAVARPTRALARSGARSGMCVLVLVTSRTRRVRHARIDGVGLVHVDVRPHVGRQRGGQRVERDALDPVHQL